MEFRDLKKQYQMHRQEIDNAIKAVVNEAHFISGPQVTQLEEKLAAYVGVKHCIACANGTDALQLTLMAWGIAAGDAVFVPDFTFFSSGEVVPLVGASPVFVDIDADTYNISPESLERAIEYVIQNTDLKPRVIVAVDLFGQPADYEKIRRIADKYDLLVLEDAAQGLAVVWESAGHAVSVISLLLLSFRQSHWGVMGTAAQCLRTMMSGLICYVPCMCMAKAGINTTISVSD